MAIFHDAAAHPGAVAAAAADRPAERRANGARRRSARRRWSSAGRANNALYVYALKRSAQRLGLYQGQPLANARAMVRETCGRARRRKGRCCDLLETIADWCDRFTPLVTPGSAGRLAAGHHRRRASVRRRSGDAEPCDATRSPPRALPSRPPSPAPRLAARALARYANGTIAPPGGEADGLGAAAHRGAGLRRRQVCARCNAPASRPSPRWRTRGRAELAARLGAGFVTRLDVMLGAEEKPMTPRRPLPDLRAEQRFAEPVVTQDVIAGSRCTAWRTP